MSEFNNVKTIAVDFDGVIHSYEKGWLSGVIYGTPMRDSKLTINELIKKGFKVVVFTARTELDPVRKWLVEYDFPELEVTNIKPPAMCYIDDRAIRFRNWKDIRNYYL